MLGPLPLLEAGMGAVIPSAFALPVAGLLLEPWPILLLPAGSSFLTQTRLTLQPGLSLHPGCQNPAGQGHTRAQVVSSPSFSSSTSPIISCLRS